MLLRPAPLLLRPPPPAPRPRRARRAGLPRVLSVLLGGLGSIVLGSGQPWPAEARASEPPAARASATEFRASTSTPAPADVRPAAVPLADDPVTQAIWSAAALHRILADRDYPALLSLAVTNRTGTEEPGRLDALLGVLSAAPADRLGRCRGLPDPVEGTLCSLEVLVPLLPPRDGRVLADEGARLLSLYLRPGDPMVPGIAGIPMPGASGGEGRRFGPLQGFAQEILESSLQLYLGLGPGGVAGGTATFTGGTEAPGGAAGGATGALAGAVAAALAGTMGGEAPGAGNLFASTLSTLVGFSPEAGPEGILAEVPGLQALLRAHPGVASFESSAGGAVRATVAGGQAVLDDYQRFLTSVTGSAQGLLDHRFTRLLAEGSPEGATSTALDWASQRSFVYLASRTAALAGIETSVTDRIRTLGNAATDLRQEGLAFRANLTGLGQQAAMAALSGNVFTLASGVATFFQLTPGAMGAGAAGEIRAIRGLVEDLQEEMAVGFADVGRQLDQVMGELDRGFGRMESLVVSSQAQVREELRALGDELAALGSRVDRLDANLVAYLQAGFDRDYTRTLILCLEHRERHLPPFDEIPFDRFSTCLADFRARGSQDARDALLTDRTTPVDDRALAEALADPSPANLARRLPLLARTADQRLGTPAMEGGRGGANPVEWAVATQAYLSMLQAWPGHAGRITTGDLEALLATGVEIERIMAGAEAALDAALRHYREGVQALREEAESLAARHQQAQLRRVDPAELVNRMTPEAVGRPTLPAPPRVAGNLPGEVRTAAVLALETPVLVYRTSTADSIATGNERRRFLFFGRRHDREVHVRTGIEVELRIRNGEVVRRFRAQGPPVLSRVETVSGRADPAGGPVAPGEIRGVDNRIPDPEGHFLETIFPTLAGNNGAWTLTPPPPALLARLEAEIEAELRRFESATLNRVFGAVCETGAPGSMAMDPVDAASVTRLREALDRMGTARLLLQSYARLVLPGALETDPELQALLGAGGNSPGSRSASEAEGLLDRASLCRLAAAGESPLRVVWLEAEPQERADRLEVLLTRARADLRAGREAGGLPVPQVTGTLQQVRAAIRLQEVRTRIAPDLPGQGP